MTTSYRSNRGLKLERTKINPLEVVLTVTFWPDTKSKPLSPTEISTKVLLKGLVILSCLLKVPLTNAPPCK